MGWVKEKIGLKKKELFELLQKLVKLFAKDASDVDHVYFNDKQLDTIIAQDKHSDMVEYSVAALEAEVPEA